MLYMCVEGKKINFDRIKLEFNRIKFDLKNIERIVCFKIIAIIDIQAYNCQFFLNIHENLKYQLPKRQLEKRIILIILSQM